MVVSQSFRKREQVNLLSSRVIIALLFLFGHFLIFTSPLRFTGITTDNGLSNNTISFIYKDLRGFIRLGTQNGLNRFDGINIVNYPVIPVLTSVQKMHDFSSLIITQELIWMRKILFN